MLPYSHTIRLRLARPTSLTRWISIAMGALQKGNLQNRELLIEQRPIARPSNNADGSNTTLRLLIGRVARHRPCNELQQVTSRQNMVRAGTKLTHGFWAKVSKTLLLGLVRDLALSLRCASCHDLERKKSRNKPASLCVW